MLDWFRSWSKGIIIAVIISTIIEMILPDNTSKKYIKIIIGIFVVYTIISPVIDKFMGQSIDDYLSFDDSIETSSNAVESNTISNNAQSSIKRIYKQNLENDLKIKLSEQGYIAESVAIYISDDDTYSLEKVELKIQKKETQKTNEKQTQSIVQSIKSVKVKLEGSSNDGDGVLNEDDKNKIKEYVKNTYEIDINKVFVS